MLKLRASTRTSTLPRLSSVTRSVAVPSIQRSSSSLRYSHPLYRRLSIHSSASTGDNSSSSNAGQGAADDEVSRIRQQRIKFLQDQGYNEEEVVAMLEILAADFNPEASKSNSAARAPSSPGSWNSLSLATKLVHGCSSVTDPYLSSGPPLWQTATFAQPTATTNGEYDYTRSGNPTRTMLEEQIAALEGGDCALAFTSGMAALAAVCKLAGSGDHILAGEDIYGGTSRLLSRVVPAAGVTVTHVDMTDVENVRQGIIPGKTKLVLVESPTNPRMQICNIATICGLARAAGAVSCVDNSIMAPMFQQPLALGADICMTSGTKFVGGHGDVTLGLLTVRGAELAARLRFLQNAEGAALAPFDCWLALRGLKTMALRMERAADNCAALAGYLVRHPLVKKVNYAGLPGHPGFEVHQRQASSGGSLLSFETGNVEASKVIVEETKLFKVTVSFGSVSSLISLPCFMSHASIPSDVRAARGLPDDLVRISAGIEDIHDLLADLDQAMSKAMERSAQGSGSGSGRSAPGPESGSGGIVAGHGHGSLAGVAGAAVGQGSQGPPLSYEELLARYHALEEHVRVLTAASGHQQ